MNHWSGRKHTIESKRKMSLAKRGKNNNFYGKKHTPESLAKMSAVKMGKRTGAKNPNWNKPRSFEIRGKISKTRIKNGVALGSKNPNWRGGITKKRKSIMTTTRYRSWRSKVFIRDDYTCQMCDKRGEI